MNSLSHHLEDDLIQVELDAHRRKKDKRTRILTHLQSVLSEGLENKRIGLRQLREPQKLAVVGCAEWLGANLEKETTMGHIVAPMGVGKTGMAILLSEVLGGKSVYLTWNKNLGDQAASAFREHQSTVAHEQHKTLGQCYGKYRNPNGDFIIGNFESFHHWGTAINWNEVHAIFVDEADVNGLSDTRAGILLEIADEYGMLVIALTATEEQSSGKKLQDIFPDSILYLPTPKTLPQLHEMDLICDVRFSDLYLDLIFQVDRESLHRIKEIEAIRVQQFIKSTSWNRLMLEDYMQRFRAPDGHCKKSLFIYRDNLLVADLIDQAAQRGIRGKAYTGEETESELARLREDLRTGVIDFLAGSRMLGRGLDIPEVEVVYNSLITMSPQMFWQAGGRGVRKDPNNPEKICHIISVLPKVTIDEKTGEVIAPELRPLCHEAFFSPQYFPPIQDRQSLLHQGKLPYGTAEANECLGPPYEVGLKGLTTIRSSQEVATIIREYARKPINFVGRIGQITKRIERCLEVTRKYIIIISRTKNIDLEKTSWQLDMVLDDLQEIPTPAGDYNYDDEMTLKEELELRKKYAENTDREEVCQRLLKAYEPIIFALARAFTRDEHLQEDLVQEGRMVFLKTLKQIGHERKHRIINYFLRGLMNRFKIYFIKQGFLLSIPGNHSPRSMLWEKMKDDHYKEKGEPLSSEEFQELFLTSEAKKGFYTTWQALERQWSDPEELEAKNDTSPSEMFHHNNLSEAIREVLATLVFREREVIKNRYGLEGRTAQTLDALATDSSVSRERIRQIEFRAIIRLQRGSRKKRLSPFVQGDETV